MPNRPAGLSREPAGIRLGRCGVGVRGRDRAPGPDVDNFPLAQNEKISYSAACYLGIVGVTAITKNNRIGNQI